jgi:uncharacterized protein YggE
MFVRLFAIFILTASVYPGLACSCENDHIIKVQGESRLIAKPDVAHCFLKITGEGSSYDLSTQAAKKKITFLDEHLKTIFGEKPEISIMKVENKPKGKSYDDIYQKNFITGMAKAIKGEEIPEDKTETKKEMLTTFTVYFRLLKFTEDELIKFRTILSEKEIAFDKENPFDFSFDYDKNTSAIFFGLIDPNRHLKKLSAEAFGNALKKAEIISKGAEQNIGKLWSISGCSSDLQGSVEVSDRSNLTGKDLGPLSVDPNRLMIKFSTYYEFELTN